MESYDGESSWAAHPPSGLLRQDHGHRL